MLAIVPGLVAQVRDLAELAPDLARASAYAGADKAGSTRRAYTSDFRIFAAWCAERQTSPLPASPATVAAFLAWEADHGARASTIGRRAAAIRYAHKLAGHPVPTDDERVQATMRGIRRTVGAAKVKKSAATAERVIAMAPIDPTSLAAIRDRAIILLGFASAMRRSELVALDIEHVTEQAEGLLILIPRSKTDQDGKGETIAVPRGRIACPVAAYLAWIAAAGITSGPVFRPVAKAGRLKASRLTAQSVALVVKAAAERVGLDPAAYAGHSLRRGFLTSAAANGASVFKMKRVSRHTSMDTLQGYVDDAEIFQNHAGAGLL